MIRNIDMELASPVQTPTAAKQDGSVHLDKNQWDQGAKKYEELGLGRGVNVTDPHMWRNKTAFLVRDVHPELSNIVKTEEGGILEKYAKEVSTLSIQKRKIRLSLDDPGTQVKIGMDAQQTQSASSSVKVSGTKVKTRTISYRVEFEDVPKFTSLEKAIQAYKEKEHQGNFEHKFCCWVLERIHDRPNTTALVDLIFEKEESGSPAVQIMRFILGLKMILDAKNEESGTRKTALQERLEKVEKELKITEMEVIVQGELDAISIDCEGILEYLGITHYVSAIELGALRYNASVVKSKHTALGGGATVGIGSVFDGGLSGLTEKMRFDSSKEEHSIGRIGEDGRVKRGDEAVIGFQIQPIYNLVQVPGLQPALKKAVKEYILKKEDPSEGPFLVSCVVDKTEVFWIVEDNCVLGTTSRKDASLFYVIPTNDPKHPSEFFITYWGREEGDRKRLMNLNDPLVKLRMDNSNLPLFLSTDGNVFGMSEGPLQLKKVVVIQQARFCLHNRVQSMFACMLCLTTPVDLSGWIDLGEQFYIKCSRRPFKIDGYIAMCKQSEESRADGPSSESTNSKQTSPTAHSSSSSPQDVPDLNPSSTGSSQMSMQQVDQDTPPTTSQPKSQKGIDSRKQNKSDSAEKDKEIDRSAIKYKTLTVPSPSEIDDSGMLFRLLPPETRVQSKKKHTPSYFPMIGGGKLKLKTLETEPQVTVEKSCGSGDLQVGSLQETGDSETPPKNEPLLGAATDDKNNGHVAFNPLSKEESRSLFLTHNKNSDSEEEEAPIL